MSLRVMLAHPTRDLAVYGCRLIAAHAMLASGRHDGFAHQLRLTMEASSGILELAQDFIESVLITAPECANDAFGPEPEAA
jgi:hypothetical protein